MSEKEFLSQLKEHQNIIYKLVHLYANSEEDKKDLYQEILLQAWKTYSAFVVMQSSVHGYTGFVSTLFYYSTQNEQDRLHRYFTV